MEVEIRLREFIVGRFVEDLVGNEGGDFGFGEGLSEVVIIFFYRGEGGVGGFFGRGV